MALDCQACSWSNKQGLQKKMVRYHGIYRFQGWLVVRGGPKTARCCRKTWDEVCSIAVSFCRGPNHQRHFRWSVVASLVETRNSGRESSDHMLRGKVVDADPYRMREAVARHAEPGYRQEVSANVTKVRTCCLFYVCQCLECGGGTVKRFTRISDIVFTVSGSGHQVTGCR